MNSPIYGICSCCEVNRLYRHEVGSVTTTYTYDGDGLKRKEQTGSAITTLIWDGSDYLGEV